MKILLIQPPIQDFYQTSIRTQPIGLSYLAASLKSHGHEVEILDCQTERRKSIPIPPELSYLKDFYPFNDRSPFKLYTGFYHFGMSWDEIKKKIEDSKADVFGISFSFTPYFGQALEVARIVKEWDPKRIVVTGGAHASCDPEGVLKSPLVDYVILGEGEIRFSLLLDQIENENQEGIEEIDGVGYRADGQIRINPLKTFIQDLDSLPNPARELLDLNRYRIKKKRSTMIITSRGCPHGCTYCSAHLVTGSFFRKRSPEATVNEMVECQERHGIQIFDFEDDNFTFDKERAKSLMKLVVETFGEEKIELTAMNGISFASLDGEILKLMKRAGFHTVNLSYVSIDPLIKKRMERPRASFDFDDILRRANRVGLNVIAYAIFGMPGQTIEEMVDTLIYLMERKVFIGPSVYYPTPGTPLFEKCKKDKLLSAYPSQWRSTALSFETKDFSRLDLVTLLRLARIINFIKEKMDEKWLEEGISVSGLPRVLREKKEAKVKEKENAKIWVDLILQLFYERSFFSLRKVSGKMMSVVKEKGSKKVLDYFFEKAWEKAIMKSQID
jgi:anaerobic magnesium-protoporphyrin IX monomethyl ester cyclase